MNFNNLLTFNPKRAVNKPQAYLQSRPEFQDNSRSFLAPLTQDTVHFSGLKRKVTDAERAEAEKYVDGVIDKANQVSTAQRMTLRQFLVEGKLDPARFFPTASSYVLDAFDFYDGEKGPEMKRVYGEMMPHYKIMDASWNEHLTDRGAIFGQEPTVNRVVEIIKAFRQQPNVDRGIVFFGPHGSGKSLIAKNIMAGVEHFSKQDDGALWTFSFIFKDGKKIDAMSKEEAEQWMKDIVEGKKLIEPEMIAAQLMANLNLNPIFLLPPDQRVKYFQELREEGRLDPQFNIDYYLKSNLEGYAQRVLDKLYQLYSNDDKKFQKMMEHIQVERWSMSMQDYRGLVEVPAAKNPDASLREREASGPNDNVPELVRNAGKRTIDGLMPRAHRGIFYMDDFGRGNQSTDHLLAPLETGEITINEAMGGPGVTKELLDFIPMFSMNPEMIEKMRKEGRAEALEERMLFVPVPYERRYREEMKILEPIINRAKARGKVIIPGTLETFALWVAMTRMFPVNTNYAPYKEIIGTGDNTNKEFESGIKKLTPLGKALLYQEETLPFATAEEQKALDEHLKVIAGEHTQSLGETEFVLYEGGLGMSTRAAMNMLKQITNRPGNEPLTFIDVFEAVARFAINSPKFEQKRAEILKGRRSSLKFDTSLQNLKELELHTRRTFLTQLKEALGMFKAPEEHVREIQQYAHHIEALRDGRTVDDKYRLDINETQPSLVFIKNFEDTMHPDSALTEEKRQEYRSNFLTRSIAWESSESDFDNVTRIYQDEISKLRYRDEKQNQDYLEEFRRNVKILLKTPKAFESQKGMPAMTRMETALEKLNEAGYTTESLPRILDWALENRLTFADQASHYW